MEEGYEDQPAGVITLSNGVAIEPIALDDIIKDEGLTGYTSTGQEVLIYDTDDNPEEFSKKFGRVVRTINKQFKSDDIQRPAETIRTTIVRVRRTTSAVGANNRSDRRSDCQV